ncbi:MAG: MBL fold metallo-hydrolase [Clostridiales bacterium]|nr:MBL fold metallo-hydrolase [Clostridiales bacterium]
MIRKWFLFILILLVPAFASADPVIFHTLDGGSAPYETVSEAAGGLFADGAELLTVDFIDRGASDCIMLRCGGETMLVDGAIFNQFAHIESVFRTLDVTHFTYLLNTHAHDDHIEGLLAILRRDYTVDEYMSCYPDGYNGSEYQTKARELLAAKNIPYRQIGDGDRFTLGGAEVTVFRDETPGIDKNRHSIILKVVFGERSVLLMADAVGQTQEYLLGQYDPSVFKADVLKYPHHGYVNMTSAFLQAVSPELCVITNTRASAALAERQLAALHIPRYYTNAGVVRMQTDGKIWRAEQMPFGWPSE